MLPLGGAQVRRQLAFDGVVDVTEKVIEQDVFGGDGGVGLEFERPMAIVVLSADEPG